MSEYMAITAGLPLGAMHVTPDANLRDDDKLYPLPAIPGVSAPHFGCHPNVYNKMKALIYGGAMGVFVDKEGENRKVRYEPYTAASFALPHDKEPAPKAT